MRVTGNLFRTADGRLAYIDFGMMGEIEPDVRRCPQIRPKDVARGAVT